MFIQHSLERKGIAHGRFRRSTLVSISHRRNAVSHHMGHELRSVAFIKLEAL